MRRTYYGLSGSFAETGFASGDISQRSDAPVILNLEIGDMLVLATDGFFEWENEEGEQFGFTRMTQAVREARHLPPDEIIEKLHGAVKTFANGTKQIDDLTVVVIKRVADQGIA